MSIKRELVWEMDRIVQVVSDNLRTDLEQVIPGFVDINFQFGHPLEIKEGLKNLGKTDRRAEKWPIISLYRPYQETVGRGEYDSVRLTMLIANYTTPNRMSRDRQLENFEPILLPIYRELMRQIARSKFFAVMSQRTDMPHTLIQHDYFGKADTPDANRVYHDYVDAIEIRDLDIKITHSSYCC